MITLLRHMGLCLMLSLLNLITCLLFYGIKLDRIGIIICLILLISGGIGFIGAMLAFMIATLEDTPPHITVIGIVVAQLSLLTGAYINYCGVWSFLVNISH